ncbi:unnamed protein product [Prunus armeniaca]|uniref:Uncharacterized protein n=1 Tax=Prunus armeniaca TaxID=36596 RepID=A0A6J5UB58_PRUAR|nr:unnamed protein product [Prunus armeniaca]
MSGELLCSEQACLPSACSVQIDPCHRYGQNLHLLDVGDGKEVNLDKCPRTDLQGQCIKYLGPKEREAYEVIMESGKLVYRQSRKLVNTAEGCKWIFVLSTSRKMYVGEKKKGLFQHSTFLAGGATLAAGRIVAFNGVLEAVWSYSGHYRPTEENFMEFISFLEEHQVDLTDVKKYPIDDDVPPSYAPKKEMNSDITSANVDVWAELRLLQSKRAEVAVLEDFSGLETAL